jgi:2'-5' RNA ligase
MRLLRRRGRARPTAVLVPVPAAGPAFASWGLPPGGAGAAPGMPPHVTVLFPFLTPDRVDDGVRDGLSLIAAATAPFTFDLVAVERFPGVLYLAPRPAEPFAALTAAVVARWPGHPPYGGAFDEVVPHLTVASGAEPGGLEAQVAAALPLAARAEELVLMSEGADGTWERLDAFALGGRR